MTVANSITKIRRLVNDVNTQDFTDAQILTLFGRAQQKFCRDTLSEVAVVSLLSPPQIDYAGTYTWEESYVSGSSFFCPFFRTATYSASQAWELEEDQISTGGYTVTSGGDAEAEEPQHLIPFFLPSDFYAFKGLTWNKKWVPERSMDKMQEIYRDAFRRMSDVVDWFSPLRAGRSKAFVAHGIPTTTGEATDQATAIDVALVASVFYAMYVQVPDRPTATTDSVEVFKPFRKYIEFAVAEQLLRFDGPKKNKAKAKHFQARYQLGKILVQKLMWKLLSNRKLQLGDPGMGGVKPARPRMPDHYPRVNI